MRILPVFACLGTLVSESIFAAESVTDKPPGLAPGPMAPTWNEYFDHYLEGKTITRASRNKANLSGDEAETPTKADVPADTQGWQARNGTLTVKDGILALTPHTLFHEIQTSSISK